MTTVVMLILFQVPIGFYLLPGPLMILIASGSTDETVHIWEPTGKRIKIFRYTFMECLTFVLIRG